MAEKVDPHSSPRLPIIGHNLFCDFSMNDKLFFIEDHGELLAQVIFYDNPYKLFRLDGFYVELKISRLTGKPEAIYSIPECRVAKLYKVTC